ncbi:MAG: amidohydrolase family protein [Pseudomonadota bacterium]
MKKIAIEEHFWSKRYFETLISNKGFPRLEMKKNENGQEELAMWNAPDSSFLLDPGVSSKLLDVGEKRLEDMDRVGIDMQVLSLGGPGLEVFEPDAAVTLARKANDDLGVIIAAHPERFAGFAAIPTQAPEAAAEELERAVKVLGFRGAKVSSHIKGTYLDEDQFRVIFETAESLEVPIYLHPRLPPREMIGPYLKYRELAGPMWGFAADTGLHALRLICSGLFDLFPKLRIILGHLGEALPFWLTRLDNRWQWEGAQTGRHTRELKKNPSHYIKKNFLITTSGMCSQPALICSLLAMGAESILFAVDYPWESADESVAFLESAPISEGDKEKIFYRNAQRYLGL